uniref:Uncharacterized protein n=1 Tax=Aegilops tauschii subsp. strangulata TaxID=200361 RepID=A0A453B6Z1_AEGTS
CYCPNSLWTLALYPSSSPSLPDPHPLPLLRLIPVVLLLLLRRDRRDTQGKHAL